MSWLWGSKKNKKDHDDEDDSSYEDEEHSDDGEDDEEYTDDEDENDEGVDKPHHQRHHEGKLKQQQQAKDHSAPAAADNAKQKEQRDPSPVKDDDDDGQENDVLPVAEKTQENDRKITPAGDADDNHNITTRRHQEEEEVDYAPEPAAAAAGEDTTEQQSSKTTQPPESAAPTTKRSNNKSHEKVTLPKKNSTSDDDDEEEEEEEIVVTDEDVLVGNIPQNVTSNRPRFPSALSADDGGDNSDNDNDVDDDETSLEDEKNNSANVVLVEEDDFETVNVESDNSKEEEDESEEEDATTSIAEKQSLLVLAAEHDRVDILQALLNEAVVVPANSAAVSSANNNNSNNRTPQEEQRHVLLHGGIPPLHVAIKHGSINATNCLLRMGADPSIRPNVQALSLSCKNHGGTATPVPKDLDGVSAWELAFGARPVSMPPSKREGIRHAFTAEALRCIGSDEADRLQQLLDAGMPIDIEMGGKNLYDWAVDLQGVLCQKALRPQQQSESSTVHNENGTDTSGKDDANNDGQDKTKTTTTAVLDRPSGKETFAQLVNRFDELENLARALSTCLDNLAEEVSVCHGLLLMGGGATALASHVRSLKALKERKHEELTRLEESWENSQDELAYWVRECGGPEGEEIAAQITPADMHLLVRRQSLLQGPKQNDDPLAPPISAEEREASRLRQLQAQIAASESKVRKLRVSIADLSEENARDLQEVENRGLTGGIHLVRGLRDEIREVEFAISEVKSADAGCRAKISMIQTKVQQRQSKSNKTTPTGQTKSATVNGVNASFTPSLDKDDALVNGSNETAVVTEETGGSHTAKTTPTASTLNHSERMAAGQSTAIAIRTNVSGRGGYFTIGLWQIIMRIIGIGASEAVASHGAPRSSGGNRTFSRSSSTSTAPSSAQPAMIV